MQTSDIYNQIKNDTKIKEDLKPRTKEEKDRNNKAWNRFYEVLPIFIFAYILIIYAFSAKYQLNKKIAENINPPAIEVEYPSIKVDTVYDLYQKAHDKNISGTAPTVSNIDQINENTVEVTTTADKAILSINPMYIGKNKNDKYIVLEASNGKITFSLKDIESTVKKNVIGILQDPFPGSIYLINEDKTNISPSKNLFISRDDLKSFTIKEAVYG